MNRQPGIITYTDRYQVQQTAESAGLNSFFNEMGITKGADLRNRLSNIFVNGSMNRSQFFMDFRIKDWTFRGGSAGYMPVYGVKGGSPGLTRQTNYAEILFCSEEKLATTGFNEVMFGTDYLSGEETVELPENELLDALGREGSVPGFTISTRNKENVCRVIEKLWEVQEKDPRTRFVILMDRAEENSISLIQQIYLLLPQKLRQQIGFQTNISAADLEQIQAYEGVPIYLFTADISENIDSSRYSFPVAVFDLTRADEYTFNEERLALIRKLASQINEKKGADLDYSEKHYLESQNSNASSFRYYENIVKNMFSGALFWWTKERIDSVEELEKLYTDQGELMNVPDYRTQALTSYYLDIYPKSNIAQQTVEIISNENYPNRARLLNFLASELGHAKEIDAIDTMRTDLLSQMRTDLEKKDTEWNQRLNSELTKMSDSTSAELKRLRAENKALTERLGNVQTERGTLSKSGNGLENQALDIDDRSKLQEKTSKLKEELGKARKTRTIMSVLAGVFAVAAIAMCILLFSRSSQISELTANCEQLKKDYQEVTDSEANLANANKELMTQNEELKKQIEMTRNELDILKQQATDELADEAAGAMVNGSEPTETAPPDGPVPGAEPSTPVFEGIEPPVPGVESSTAVIESIEPPV